MNTVNLIGNLTKDPVTRETKSETTVVGLRIAVNGRRNGEKKTHYFDVTTFGVTAENCARFLSKGRKVAIVGRLDHQEWKVDGDYRSKVEIIASEVEFLPSPDYKANDGHSTDPAEAAPAAEADTEPEATASTKRGRSRAQEPVAA